MRRRRRPAHELRIAIDCLPLDSRRAMLEGVESNRIIVGAYVDRDGGVCPMLAAHRHGGRTALASFARAWDRYTRAGRGPRRATDRELRTLTTMLEASIALDERLGATELKQAILEHSAAKERRPQRRRPRGDRDRAPELRRPHGWAWMRPLKRWDEYEVAVAQLEDLERTGAGDREPERV
jgi:hypothetical protein